MPTRFSDNQIIIQKKSVATLPATSNELVLFFDGEELRTVDYSGKISNFKPQKRVVSGSRNVRVQETPTSFIISVDIPQQEQIGFIAEDVALVDERLVERNQKGEIESVQYSDIIVPLVAKIQKHDDIINSLLKRIDKLESKQT